MNHVGSLEVIGNDPNQSFLEAMVHDLGVLHAAEEATSGQKKNLPARLHGIDLALARAHSDSLVKLGMKLCLELEEVML
ncbi:hypothetical protein V6N12_057392 [Hibiscus sabdariffa]|uniref:Uncharacterized protein n=1 Tax=Hibiscus sabdariffa TaxID=183260 RepID=A0ABR2DBP8_9ROSI